ncbi:MAG: PilZ domain-containing protein [Gammaproteobacteria bacterium]|nr:PilZ domain-containing protein [Gammaproteobacteria bacterium]MCB1849406.1 PilZ domain-containing protein [Gammaproteobacteria bacterium]
MRGYHRHLSEMPLELSLEPMNRRAHERLVNISCGGLAFSTRSGVEPGAMIHITIPLGKHRFETVGSVIWCHKTNNHFEVGVRFNDPQTEYQTQMIEQLCHIERYRWKIQDEEGRLMSSEEAAMEWISRYANVFRH